jgi:hypothetical protein
LLSGWSAYQFGVLYSCTIALPSVSAKPYPFERLRILQVLPFCALAIITRANPQMSAIPSFCNILITSFLLNDFPEADQGAGVTARSRNKINLQLIQTKRRRTLL